MRKIGLVARRDFIATVGNKGFLIGLLILPALIGVLIALMPRFMNAPTPQVRGEVVVIDPTARVAGELRRALDPAAIAARRAEAASRALAAAPAAIGAAAAANEGTIRSTVGQVPEIRLVERPAGVEVQGEKDWLSAESTEFRHLALIVVHADAVARVEGQKDFGAYDLYRPASLDEGTETVIHEGLRQAIVAARLRAVNLDQASIEATMRVPRPTSVMVTQGREQRTERRFNRLLPFIMGMLLFMGVMIGGQTLMTSTVEEKSSRVVEVLLAAVSPFELMAGKLLGQLAVSLLVMSLYIALGLLALFSFAMFGLFDMWLVVYLVVFFLLSYLVFGGLMMTIGASVNEMAEAQSLMGPVMLMLMAPWMLAPAIQRAPDSTFSVLLSFIPPMNTFAMMTRLSASSVPPPAWQIGLTIVIGLAAAGATVWFAAKVFKVGLLMHGKPPNLATLVRWARAA